MPSSLENLHDYEHNFWSLAQELEEVVVQVSM